MNMIGIEEVDENIIEKLNRIRDEINRFEGCPNTEFNKAQLQSLYDSYANLMENYIDPNNPGEYKVNVEDLINNSTPEYVKIIKKESEKSKKYAGE